MFGLINYFLSVKVIALCYRWRDKTIQISFLFYNDIYTFKLYFIFELNY